MQRRNQNDQQLPQQPPQDQRVYYITRGNAPRIEENRDLEQIVVVVDDEIVRLFVRQVYLLASTFIISSILVWVIICLSEFNLYKVILVPPFVWILLAFIFLMILNCCPQTRYIYPINWTLTIFVVIFISLAGACVMHEFPKFPVIMGLMISGVLVASCYACGAMCPQQLLPGGVCSACLMLVLFVLLFVFCVIMFFVHNPIYALLFIIALFLLILLSMPFHAQYMHGRLAIVPLFEKITCALVIYIDFVVLFYCLGYFYYYHEYVLKKHDSA